MNITSGWPFVSVFSISGTPLIYELVCKMLYYRLLMLCPFHYRLLMLCPFFSPVFFLYFSWLVSVTMFTGSLILSSTVFNLLLSPFSDCFIYGISAWLFLLVSIPLLRFLYLFIPYFPLNS